MRQAFLRWVRPRLATTRLQPLFERLHELALVGMNIGGDCLVGSSGELAVLRLVRDRNPGEVVVFDVGANSGAYGSAVLKVFGERVRLHCFEPSKAAFAELQTQLGHQPAVTLYNIGLSETPETATLYSDSRGSPLGSVYPRAMHHHGVDFGVTEKVSLSTLDNVCEAHGIHRIHLLKLDVEGHDLKVLRGAERLIAMQAIDCIQFEFGGCDIDSRTYLRDFFDLLVPAYRLHRVVANGVVPLDGYRETYEVFLTTNFLAIANA